MLGVSAGTVQSVAALVAALLISVTAGASATAFPAAPAPPGAKVDSQLRSLVAGRQPPNVDLRRGRVEVMVEAASGRTARAAAAVTRAGGVVQSRYGSLVDALLEPASLPAVARDPSVSFIRPPLVAHPDAVSEGVAALNAPDWHARGLTGSGVKVAVIDASFKDHEKLGLTVEDFVEGADCDATSAHGTAVAQVVREVAPAAQLLLLCVRDEEDLFRAADAAVRAGAKIIVHSLSWFNGGRGDGVAPKNLPEGTAEDAKSRGVLWVNSVGNFAPRHWSGTFSDPDGDNWHNFAGGDEGNGFSLPAEGEICIFLKWDDWGPEPRQPSSTQDFNLSVFGVDPRFPGPEDHILEPAFLTPIASSANPRGRSPTEQICYRSPSAAESRFYIGIQRSAATATPRFDLFVTAATLEYRTPEGSVAEPATSPHVLAVGAVCWRDDTLPDYTSRGPTIDGRPKPDIAGPDSVSSPFPEFGTFTGCGTSGFRGSSAAAPHVAGAAALVVQAHPEWTVDQIRGYLEQQARDLGPPGKDNLFGSGKAWLPSAAAPPSPPVSPPPPASPPPAAPPPPAPKLRLLGFTTSPKRSRAGERFLVRALVALSGTQVPVSDGRLACAATLGRRSLRPVMQRFRDAVARCGWALPRSASGKRLRGSLTVRSRGVTLTRRFEQRVLRPRGSRRSARSRLSATP